MDKYINEVYQEAKERQKRIERIGRDISTRMHSLHDYDSWKRWGTYQHIDRTVARANEKVSEWKETAWPKIRFLDDVETASDSSTDDDDESDDADTEDEYAKLGAAAPKD